MALVRKLEQCSSWEKHQLLVHTGLNILVLDLIPGKLQNEEIQYETPSPLCLSSEQNASEARIPITTYCQGKQYVYIWPKELAPGPLSFENSALIFDVEKNKQRLTCQEGYLTETVLQVSSIPRCIIRPRFLYELRNVREMISGQISQSLL